MKKYLLGIIAVLFAIGFSAFDNTKKTDPSTPLQPMLFTYNGGIGGPTDPTNYELKEEQVQECFLVTSDLCEVTAIPENPEDDPQDWRPDLSSAQFHYRN